MKPAYEIDCLLFDDRPREYWLHRLERGRRVRRWGPYKTEAAVREEAALQMIYDVEERERTRETPRDVPLGDLS